MRFCILIGVSMLIGETCFIFIVIRAEELNQYHFCNKTRCAYEPSADYADCKNKDLVKIPPQCSSAEYLDLRKNDLQYIGPTSLSKYKNLKYLYLDGNQIRNITPRAFAECGSLQQLFLQNNPIRIILSEALAGLTDLRQLYLNLAQLEIIQPNAFDDMKALLRLFLSDNSLVTLPLNLFKELQNLQILTLANNRLKSLSSDTFQGLIRLEYIDIKQNSLTILPNGLSNNMLFLKRLTLSYNAIHTIERGAIDFDHLPKLENLDMRNNSIKSVANFSSAILHISNIFISNNPLHCSCSDINGLLIWYELHSEVMEPATCTTPSAFAGMLVRDIMANETLSCDKIIYPSPTNAQPAKTVILKMPRDSTTMPQHDVNVVSQTNFVSEINVVSEINGVIPDLVTYSATLTNDTFQNDTEILARKSPTHLKNSIMKFAAIAMLAATAVILIMIVILIIVKCRRERTRKRSNSNNMNHQSPDGLYEQVRGSESTISTHLESPPKTPESPNSGNESFSFLQTPSSNQISYVPHLCMHPNHSSPSNSNHTNHNAKAQLPDVAYVEHTNNPYAAHIQTTNVDKNQQIHPKFDPMIAHNTPASPPQTDIPSLSIPSPTPYPQPDTPSPPIPLPDVQLTSCRCPIQHLPNNNPFCAQNNMINIHTNPICA